MSRGKAIKVPSTWLDNIRAWLDKGRPEDGDWYRDAHRWCKGVARKTNSDYRRNQ
jgi:hypothetical protein